MARSFSTRAKGRPRGKEYIPGPPTDMLVGSSLEVKVYWALKWLKWPFTTQVNFEGGAAYPGGTRVDFVLGDRPAAMYVHGPYYHETAYSRAKDVLNEIALRAAGKVPVIIWYYELEGSIQDVAETIQRRVGYALGRTGR